MAFVTVPVELEGHLAVVAGPAIFTFPVFNLTYLGRICLHIEIEFGMADPAGVFYPVFQVREYDRLDAVPRGGAIDDDVAELLRRRERRQVKGFPPPGGGKGEYHPDQLERDPCH